MIRPAHRLFRPCLAAAVLLAAGCAHAPASAGGEADEPDTAGPAERVLVTGSHVPRQVDARGRIPDTSSNVRIYSRQDVHRTGSSDLRVALQKLDPSF